mmetsp:Transcript_52741/g.150432  ORF Transcript_52741/g.150432 Transcript_52741/m.150432 type:complete len:227 (+) Transcript_52741:968-1648(+)
MGARREIDIDGDLDQHLKHRDVLQDMWYLANLQQHGGVAQVRAEHLDVEGDDRERLQNGLQILPLYQRRPAVRPAVQRWQDVLDVGQHDVLHDVAGGEVLAQPLLVLRAVEQAVVDGRQEALHDDIGSRVALLVLADTLAEGVHHVELDDSPDQPVDVAVEQRRELRDLLALQVLARRLHHRQEYRVGRRELHEAAAGGLLHLEGCLAAGQEEGDEAHRAGNVVVG